MLVKRLGRLKVSVVISLLALLVLGVACGSAAPAEPAVVERVVEQEVIKEVVKEVPVDREVIREVEREVVVDREVPVEVQKEVVVEREVTVEREVLKEVIVIATPTPHPLTYPPPKVTPAGTLISVGHYWGFMGVDTNISEDSSTKIYYNELFEYPIDQNLDGSLKPGFVSKWEVSPDFLTWTLTIRDGVLFHDGTRLTAENAAWGWNRSIAPDSLGGFGLEVAPLLDPAAAGFVSTGDAVQFTTQEPASTIIMNFTSVSPSRSTIFPQTYFEQQGVDGFTEKPIGTGPYQFVRRVPGQYMELTAFEDHYEKFPGYKDLQIWDVAELTTRIALLKTGKADLISASVRNVDELEEAGFDVRQVPGANVSWMWYNHHWKAGHIFNDKRVREALSIAIDRQGIGDGLYAGQADPICCAYAVPGNIGYPPEGIPHPYNPERAKELLAEAGYGDGFPVEVYTYVGDADFVDLPGLTEAVAGYLEAIGLKATVKVVDGQAFKAIFSGSNNDPEALKESLADEPPYVLGVRGSDTRYHTFRTSYIWHHSKGKFGYNQDPNIADALLDKAAAAFDLNDQHEALAEYQLHMNREYWHAPLLSAVAVFAVDKERVGTWHTVNGRPFAHNHWSIRPPQ